MLVEKEWGWGGCLAVLVELSLDISCQHFITVAVIKSRSPALAKGS